jgi:hypothetical protein
MANLYTEKEGLVDRVPNVDYEVAFALIKGKELTAEATSWREFSNEFKDTKMAFLIHLLAVEDTEMGASYINVSKEAKPALYTRCTEAIARKAFGSPQPSDKDIFKNYITNNYTINKTQLADINAAMEKLKSSAKKPAKGESTGGKGSGGKRSGDAEATDNGGEEDAEGTDASAPKKQRTLVTIAYVPINLTAEMARDYVLEDSRDASFETNLIPIPKEGDDVMPKVTFTVSLVPDARGVVMGYLCRFLVHDRTFNFGEMLYKLERQHNYRMQNASSNFYRDPWSQYSHLSASDFPAFGFHMDKWIHCVNATRGERPAHDRLTQQLGQRDRADSYMSPTHPKNVFTLVVALKRLQNAKGVLSENPPSLCEHVARYHADRPIRIRSGGVGPRDDSGSGGPVFPLCGQHGRLLSARDAGDSAFGAQAHQGPGTGHDPVSDQVQDQQYDYPLWNRCRSAVRSGDENDAVQLYGNVPFVPGRRHNWQFGSVGCSNG